jgi:hypothetical protein
MFQIPRRGASRGGDGETKGTFTSGFYLIVPCIEDSGRVVLGGGYAGVPMTNGGKIRT